MTAEEESVGFPPELIADIPGMSNADCNWKFQVIREKWQRASKKLYHTKGGKKSRLTFSQETACGHYEAVGL